MTITVFGTGCPKCQTTEKHALEALQALGLDAEIEHVRDPLQNKLVAALDDMTHLQREANEAALQRAYGAYTATRNFILLLGMFAAGLVFAVALAVSRRVATQTRQLDNEKIKFKTLFESNSDAVVILGDQGFLDCNPATLQMFRLESLEEFLGSSS